MTLMKKSSIVGVSVTPEVGLEVAVVDTASGTVLKYGRRQLEYDSNRREIADLDLFKESLADIMLELQIPKGTGIVLNIPTVVFKTSDYPAALNKLQISNAIEDELSENFIFKTVEPAVSVAMLPNASMQFYKVAYTAAQKQMLIEIAVSIKDLGFKLVAIDTSVNSILNALIYKQRVDVSNDISWILLIVENNCCRVISMNGKNYVDLFEERISIGMVLDDTENYSTVLSAVTPILKNIPAKYLCVVSTTDIISAEALAGRLSYSAPIIHQEANRFLKEPLMEYGAEVSQEDAIKMSLGVIGASIYSDMSNYMDAHFNLFNKSLGEVYTSEQPPEINLFGKTIVFTNSFITTALIFIALPIVLASFGLWSYYGTLIARNNDKLSELERQATDINRILKENEHISANEFDEGDEIRMGLTQNKKVYSYYTIVGTEIPKKLWLTHLKFNNNITIEGQADNLESVYSFFRSIKDYDTESGIKLQKLGLASKSNIPSIESLEGGLDTDSILTSLNADFYEFTISDDNSLRSSQIKGKNSQQSDSIPDLPMEPMNETN